MQMSCSLGLCIKIPLMVFRATNSAIRYTVGTSKSNCHPLFNYPNKGTHLQTFYKKKKEE